MLQTFTFTGTGRQCNALASYFKYESGSAGGADESIRVRADGQDLGEYYPGDSVRLPVNASTWEIAPNNGACTGRVRLGVGEVESSRLVGNVKVIDQGADKTRAGKQFWNGYTAPAQAGAVTWAYLCAVSGEVAVKRLAVASATAGRLDIAIGLNTGTTYTSGSKFALLNKYILSAGSTVAKIGHGYSAASAPVIAEVPGFIGIGNVYVPANTVTEIPLTTPLILKDGNLLMIGTSVVNRDVQIIADVEEL